MPALALKDEIEENKPEVELKPFLRKLKKELELSVKNQDNSSQRPS